MPSSKFSTYHSIEESKYCYCKPIILYSSCHNREGRSTAHPKRAPYCPRQSPHPSPHLRRSYPFTICPPPSYLRHPKWLLRLTPQPKRVSTSTPPPKINKHLSTPSSQHHPCPNHPPHRPPHPTPPTQRAPHTHIHKIPHITQTIPVENKSTTIIPFVLFITPQIIHALP
ncbi:hypothetical protein [Encephalitozoon cuniculi GB-M1]|uniref:Uncharacterized protein n=1 Tax=Encephalitozoon cuniculi (strain GB-M1) TaxID=284813 RepID=Q8SVY7_ENCCU|nr:uncharacterized protein ECU04_0030 [Encephalitozoon cuniculi GB-M1]CAD25190.1 hypothetical protein [Encephalitozoon cuniculi GB-M1]